MTNRDFLRVAFIIVSFVITYNFILWSPGYVHTFLYYKYQLEEMKKERMEEDDNGAHYSMPPSEEEIRFQRIALIVSFFLRVVIPVVVIMKSNSIAKWIIKEEKAFPSMSIDKEYFVQVIVRVLGIIILLISLPRTMSNYAHAYGTDPVSKVVVPFIQLIIGVFLLLRGKLFIKLISRS